jgi:hypothetical protein
VHVEAVGDISKKTGCFEFRILQVNRLAMSGKPRIFAQLENDEHLPHWVRIYIFLSHSCLGDRAPGHNQQG